MIIAFQIILLLIIPVSFITMFADNQTPEQKKNLAFVCVGAMIVFCIVDYVFLV